MPLKFPRRPESASPSIALCGWLFALLPLPAAAQSCWVSGALNLPFGAINISSPTDVSTSLPYTCGGNGTPIYFRMCMYIADVPPLTDTNPRRMTNYNGSYLQYNLYSDATRTQIIGPSTGGYPEYTWTKQIPGNGGYAASSGTIPIYGRVFSGQGAAPAGGYASQSLTVSIRYASSYSAPPASCSGGQDFNVGVSGISATVPSGCRIQALSDLDFGTLAAPLSSAHDQFAMLTMQCPVGTTWRIGLDNGNNYAGSRRMKNTAGAFVGYQLYRNAGRSMLWGNVTNNSLSGNGTGTPATVPIYGRIPAQSATSGIYTDVVILTVTY